MMRKLAAAGLIVSALAGLPGCKALSAVPVLSEFPLIKGRQVNLLESSYGAADMLSHQVKDELKPAQRVRVGMLSNLYPPAQPGNGASPPWKKEAPMPLELQTASRVPLPQSAPFGRIIAQQVGSRFVQLGYNIVNDGNAPRSGEAMITGQYARADGRVLVSLRMVEVGNGRVLGVYDYAVPVSSEVDDLLKPEQEKTGVLDF